MAALKNAKHEAVAVAYIADPERIGWHAYAKVYPKSSRHAAETGWARLLKIVEFSARIAELTNAAAEASTVTAARVLDEFAKLAFANMADYMRVGPGGDPVLDFSKLTRDQAAALIEVTIEDFMDGRGDDARQVRRVRFRLADKRVALVHLGKHLGLFKEKGEHTGKDGGPIETKQYSDIEAARLIGRVLTKAAAAKSQNSAAPSLQ